MLYEGRGSLCLFNQRACPLCILVPSLQIACILTHYKPFLLPCCSWKVLFSLLAFPVNIFFASLFFCKLQYLRLFFVIFHTHCSFSNHVLSWSLSLCNNPPLLPPSFSLPFSAFALGLFNHWPECKTILETIGERKCFIHTQLLWKGFFWPEIRWGAQWECHRGTRYPWRFGFRPMFRTQQRRKVIPCIQRRRGPLARAG